MPYLGGAMPQTAPVINAVPGTGEDPAKHKGFRWRLWLLLAAAALFLIYLVVIACNWPFQQQALIDALQERSLRSVTIGHFSRSYFPPACTAENISFLHRKYKDKPPLITIKKMVLVTTYFRIVTLQQRLSLVRVAGMHVTVPPKQPGKPDPIMPLTYSKSAPSIKIDTIIADGAILDFMPKPGANAYRVIVDKLRLDGVGDNEPIAYKTLLSIGKPSGKLRSAGVFGTWNPKDPGSTPVKGNYSFNKADLGVFTGISGTLFSSGAFSGILRQVNVKGTANVANFRVSDAHHDRPLAVAYRAVVDGTKGNTTLSQVTAHFDQTEAEFKGSIAQSATGQGKDVSIDMWTDKGRVEDVLRLFISSPTAPITGDFSFAGHVDIPESQEPFLRRMRLTGDFGVGRGKFSNRETEKDLTRLSNSSDKHRADESPQTRANVLSDLKGHGSAVNGVATLSNLSFAMPGARADMNGTYGLIDYKVDLHGTLVTTGDPSDATTGFKKFMMEVVTPFLKKKHSARVVPFKITGSYSNTNISLDLGKH